MHAGSIGFLKGVVRVGKLDSVRRKAVSARTPTPLPSDRFEDWTDYTRVALGVEDRSSTQPLEEPHKQKQKRQQQQAHDGDRKLKLQKSATVGPRFKAFVHRVGVVFGRHEHHASGNLANQ